jgi:hypothetical protein
MQRSKTDFGLKQIEFIHGSSKMRQKQKYECYYQKKMENSEASFKHIVEDYPFFSFLIFGGMD